jgi:hypothetical protein
MGGGILNLIAQGNQNIILTGNPTKSFFKAKFSKYTNFGLQKFRINQVGQTELNISKETKYSFKINRHADLLMDMYLVVTLPNIWSPVLNYIDASINEYRPYEFQWIKNIGCQLIKTVEFTIGGYLIQKFSGSYIQNMVERDFDSNKKQLFDIMTGNTKELYDPANFSNRNNNYPNAFKIIDASTNAVEPSIASQQLYIPLNAWFSMSSYMALPLICLQYAELEVTFTLRPLKELYTIKDIKYDTSVNPIKFYENIPRIHPDQNDELYQLHRFIQEPPVRDISYNNSNETFYKYVTNNSSTLRMDPISDIHVLTTQCFLDENERTLFAQNDQSYLIKCIYEYSKERINKSSKILLESNGLVSSWMWHMQRSDVNERNEWSNYTNWRYENIIPNDLQELKNKTNDLSLYYPSHDLYNYDSSKNILITGYSPTDDQEQNHKLILKDFAIICDGKYREDTMPASIYNKIEKYNKSNGSGTSKDGLYCYNFGLNSDPYKNQPTGALNTNMFRRIEFEYNNVANPPFDLSGLDFQTICDPATGEVIGTTKDPTNIFKYNYNIHIYEERYNVLVFNSGVAELLFGR